MAAVAFTEDMIAKANAAFKPLFATEVGVNSLRNVIAKLFETLELPAQDAMKAFDSMESKQKSANDSNVPWSSEQKRGAFIVFEGLDRSGKSTQSKVLLEYMNQQTKDPQDGRMSAGAAWRCFPARHTPMGSLIDLYLRNKVEMPDAAVHLLFSANRWESAADIVKQLDSGKTVICDRYAFSGVVYSVAKGMDPTWCRTPDVGLPRPDFVFFLHLDPAVGAKRAAFGDERYENSKMQTAVREEFTKADFVREVAWHGVDGGQEKEVISEQIQKIVNEFRAQEESMPPLAPLWV